MINVLPIASGSSGNCMYIEIDGNRILVDLGIPWQWLETALKKNSIAPNSLNGILITHSHWDHTSGLNECMDHLDAPVYMTEQTKHRLSRTDAHIVSYDRSFMLPTGASVTPFYSSHDCPGTAGFIIETEKNKIGYLTDTGIFTPEMDNFLRGASCVVIESNHDKSMLLNGAYPETLKQRILSDRGHLSNDDCAAAIRSLAVHGTKHFLLAHLSKENNTASLAMETARKVTDASVTIHILPAGMGDFISFGDTISKTEIKDGASKMKIASSQKCYKIQNYEIYRRTIENRPGRYSDYPDDLLPEIKEYLRLSGIDQLYSHQAEMFELAQKRRNVVITTSTASGKTLSFLLPVLQEILKNPQARAIFVYPTKALASDQYRAIKPYLDYFGERKISAGIYDGDTPVNERSRIRNSANIILTNPEMINSAFLPNHSKNGNNFIFSNLKFIVIDELHTYRGSFGSHLANIFRRLDRICRYYNTKPQFFCSSATIANPVELAENICGKEFNLIDKDGSPASKRNYYFIQPPIIDGKDNREPVSQIASQFIPDLTTEKHTFITFCKSRRAVEVVLKEARDRLRENGFSGINHSDLISGYRGGYKPQERKLIEQKMINGQLRGLVSTNALELGIDIGKIDTAVLAGYPGTRASFWQQSGRAGRGKKESDTYLILDNLPFDQFIAINPEWLFDSGSENAVVDKNNLFIQMAHVRAAAAELPLGLDDIAMFPDLGEIMPVLMRAGELKSQNGKYVWCGGDYPAGDYSLRNMDNLRYQIIDSTNNSVISELDEVQAFREAHKHAIYIHDGQSYIIDNMDQENHRIIATPVNDDYYTVVFADTHLKVINELKFSPFGRIKIHFGDLKVVDRIGGYKKIQFHNHANLGYDKIDPPLSKSYDTEGVWINIPQNVSEVYRTLRPPRTTSLYSNHWKDYFDGVGYALHNAAMMTTMTTTGDISVGYIQSNENELPSYSVCIYDLYRGGLGYADKAYDLMDQIVRNAISLVEGCKCKDGCSVCVGDYHLDKNVVLWGLRSLYEEIQAPIVVKEIVEPTETIAEKPFKASEINERWSEISGYIRQQGGNLADFISQITDAKYEGGKLALGVQFDFLKVWVMEHENQMRIKTF